MTNVATNNQPLLAQEERKGLATVYEETKASSKTGDAKMNYETDEDSEEVIAPEEYDEAEVDLSVGNYFSEKKKEPLVADRNASEEFQEKLKK